jgi:predicted ATPase
VDATLQTTQSLLGLSTFHIVRRELQTAYALGKQCLAAAQRLHDTESLIGAFATLGIIMYQSGNFVVSREHLEQGIALYQPSQHPTLITRYAQDTGINCYNYVAQTLWTLGYPERALQRSHELVALSNALSHPYSLAASLFWATHLYLLRRETDEALGQLEVLMDLAAEQAFTFVSALGLVIRGWALTTVGRIEEGIRTMRQGIASTRDAGSRIPYQLALLAEAYIKVGDSEEGLRLVEEALAWSDKTGERHWDVEIHRIKGELLLTQSLNNQAEAVTCFQQAMTIAQSQSAKSWELRASTSLARLWQQQGQPQEAHDLLAPVYHWFTEGFDTADLKDAKMLLDALA